MAHTSLFYAIRTVLRIGTCSLVKEGDFVLTGISVSNIPFITIRIFDCIFHFKGFRDFCDLSVELIKNMDGNSCEVEITISMLIDGSVPLSEEMKVLYEKELTDEVYVSVMGRNVYKRGLAISNTEDQVISLIRLESLFQELRLQVGDRLAVFYVGNKTFELCCWNSDGSCVPIPKQHKRIMCQDVKNVLENYTKSAGKSFVVCTTPPSTKKGKGIVLQDPKVVIESDSNSEGYTWCSPENKFRNIIPYGSNDKKATPSSLGTGEKQKNKERQMPMAAKSLSFKKTRIGKKYTYGIRVNTHWKTRVEEGCAIPAEDSDSF